MPEFYNALLLLFKFMPYLEDFSMHIFTRTFYFKEYPKISILNINSKTLMIFLIKMVILQIGLGF
jgi:hypothetical protein